jgi:hypothetical protein
MSDPFDITRLRDIPDPYGSNMAVPPAPARPPSPTRSQVRRTRALALAGALAYEAAWIAHLRVHIASRSPWSVGMELLLPLSVGLAAYFAATRSGRHGLGEETTRLAWLALGLPLGFAAFTSLAWPADPHDGAFWQHALGCMISGALLASGPLLLAAFSFRRGFASASVWRTAALGVACGGLAVASLSVVCPVATAGHLIVGHGAAFAAAGLAGALLGRRVSLV